MAWSTFTMLYNYYLVPCLFHHLQMEILSLLSITSPSPVSLAARNLLPCICLVVQSCPTFCDPVDYTLPGSSVHRDSPSQNTGVGCHALLQGIFPTQGANPGLPHWRQILYHLSHQGSPRKLEGVVPGELSYSGIKPVSPALQDSLSGELPGKPNYNLQ